jgi:hypothetical protein
MTNGRDDFDKSVVDALAKRAAYICSNPDCRTLTLAPSTEDDTKFIYIGKAAHITAASSGGPRFDASLSSEERKSIRNGIFLCSNCADMIDKNDGLDYPVDLLRKWKTEHEAWVIENLNKSTRGTPKSSLSITVTSHGQRGGITAGVVSIGSQPRNLDAGFQNQLLHFLPEKDKQVTVTCVMGDGEAFRFATQIREFLVGQGYIVAGVKRAVFLAPVEGEIIDPEAREITIGTRL